MSRSSIDPEIRKGSCSIGPLAPIGCYPRARSLGSSRFVPPASLPCAHQTGVNSMFLYRPYRSYPTSVHRCSSYLGSSPSMHWPTTILTQNVYSGPSSRQQGAGRSAESRSVTSGYLARNHPDPRYRSHGVCCQNNLNLYPVNDRTQSHYASSRRSRCLFVHSLKKISISALRPSYLLIGGSGLTSGAHSSLQSLCAIETA
jgi:hypothetical protein